MATGARDDLLDPVRARRALATIDAAGRERLRAALLSLPPDARDAWWDRVLGIEEVPEDGPDLPPGCVPYVPCSVDVVLDAIEHASVGASDLVVDVGSGVGRAAALIQVLTGAQVVGLEVQSGLVRAARRLAAELGSSRLVTVHGDAAELVRSLPTATVFFLYCPFGGARLERLLDALEPLARARPIRLAVCRSRRSPGPGSPSPRSRARSSRSTPARSTRRRLGSARRGEPTSAAPRSSLASRRS
ncbi:MAG: class I SAM-dependent methyltransferase [Sandaracinaceae bacterium]|nr:class I SAM-dependent methyltransferase [Sandaracinaceae bacterium]